MNGTRIGFMGQIPEAPSSSSQNLDQVLFRFDSGLALTFAEATRHTLVVGNTGSGKTTSFIFPALDNLVRKGYAGLCIDIKGNMTEKIRNLALFCHREGDILELGVGPLAKPVNFLAGLDEAAIHEFYKIVTLKDVLPGPNMVWYMSGVRVATDLTMLCRYMAVQEASFSPTLTLVGELLTDYPLCTEIFKRFEVVAASEEEKNLIRRIQNDPFHPCNWQQAASSDRPKDYDEQVEWRTYATRNALGILRQTPGVEHGFCSAASGGLEMEKWIYEQNRIVILRFGPQSGSAGEDLSRRCLEVFYQAVFARGLGLPRGEYTFMVADEFQDFVDFSRTNRFNDNAFTAKSREFNNILIAGVQSISALLTRGGSRENAECFVNNCNNRVILYSDDPWTQAVADRHHHVRLTQLDPGEAVVVKFNQTSRRHDHGRETLQQAHDTCQTRQAVAAPLRQYAQSGNGRQVSGSETERAGTIGRLWKALQDFDNAARRESFFPRPEVDGNTTGYQEYR